MDTNNNAPDPKSIDPYKIPLATAKEWIKNWQNFDLSKPYIKPAEMKAFAVKKQDLLDLMKLAPDANWVRMYIGLEQMDDDTYQPHLVMVNATGPAQVDALTRLDIKDLVNSDVNAVLGDGDYYVNDYTKVCPPFCDPGSPLT